MSARAVFFSELLTEGVGDRGIPEWERKRRTTRRGRERERVGEVEVEREREIEKDGMKQQTMEQRMERERIVSPWVAVPNTGTHVESAKRSCSCVKCLDITVLFRLVRSTPSLAFAILSFLPSARLRAGRTRNPSSPFSRSRVRSCGFDDPSCSISWLSNLPRLIKIWRLTRFVGSSVSRVLSFKNYTLLKRADRLITIALKELLLYA